MKNAQNLINEVNKQRNNWDEGSSFEIKGIGNLSVSDLDTLKLYAETYLQYGSISSLMEPLGNISEILSFYNIKGPKLDFLGRPTL